jgi:uncharacterized protein involved in response to NO
MDFHEACFPGFLQEWEFPFMLSSKFLFYWFCRAKWHAIWTEMVVLMLFVDSLCVAATQTSLARSKGCEQNMLKQESSLHAVGIGKEIL